jgi:hypothetical protein
MTLASALRDCVSKLLNFMMISQVMETWKFQLHTFGKSLTTMKAVCYFLLAT